MTQGSDHPGTEERWVAIRRAQPELAPVTSRVHAPVAARPQEVRFLNAYDRTRRPVHGETRDHAPPVARFDGEDGVSRAVTRARYIRAGEVAQPAQLPNRFGDTQRIDPVTDAKQERTSNRRLTRRHVHGRREGGQNPHRRVGDHVYDTDSPTCEARHIPGHGGVAGRGRSGSG